MAKRSNEPIFWSLFGAGGTFAAFISPVMILITGILVPLGLLGDALSYDRMYAFVGNPLIKLIFLAVILLPLWHAGHRIFYTLHEVGIHGGAGMKAVCYGFSVAVTLIALIFLLRI
jgi:fumarate reductase subunit D